MKTQFLRTVCFAALLIASPALAGSNTSTVTIAVARAPHWDAVTRLEGTEDASSRSIQVPAGARLVLSTADADGHLDASPKGDEPGFIRVEDSKTLLIPERVGNNLAFGLSNILATGKIGLIALVPATGETLRVSGTAEIFDDAELVASLSSLGKPALLATRVHIQHCYFHCARSIVRAKLWDPKAWPAPGRRT